MVAKAHILRTVFNTFLSAFIGFDFNVIELVMRSLNFTEDEKGELDVLRKAAMKAKRKYASKATGTSLRNSVFSYLDHQGFNLDDIYIILNEMEWNDE